MIGLRIMLRPGSYLDIMMPPTEAAQHLRDWKEGMFALSGRKRIGGTDHLGFGWAIEVDSIIAMHTFTIQQAPDRPNLPTSGIN